MVTNNLKPYNFKEWVWSAKVLTTIVWILIPLVLMTVIVILVREFLILQPDDFVELAKSPTLILRPGNFFNLIPIYQIWTNTSAGPAVRNIYIPPLPLLITLLLFAVYPAIYSTEKFFRKRGNANVVIEYLYLKKILYISLAMLIIIIISTYYLQSYLESDLQSNPLRTIPLVYSEPYYTLNSILYPTLFLLPAVPISILVKFLLEHARKEFRFYYAKACFDIIKDINKEVIEDINNEIVVTEYLHLGLNWYNKFVKRVTMEGCDTETIFSKIVSHARLSDNILLNTIVDSFDERDKLKPMRHMLVLLSCWKEGGGTLIKQSLRTKIKESSDLLIPIVTVAITIISTFFLKPPK